ncbi:MAG: chemotaxis protein CheW [Planctomycetota bacterium]|nr:chemotaxis protein CheW [Planctomycetota bacterium]
MTHDSPPRTEALLAQAQRLRAQLEDNPEETEEIGLIDFELGADRFAIEIEVVSKIDKIPPITSVPNTPGFVKGVVNLRGEIFPVLDLSEMLGIKVEGEDRGMLILQEGTKRFGVVSHSLPDYFKTDPEKIDPPPKSTDIVGSILSGTLQRETDGQFVGIIDGPRLFALVARLTNAE